jgi:hypothetical protein
VSAGKRFAYRREWCSSLLISSHSHFLALALDLASVSPALLDFSIFYFLTFKPLAGTFFQSTALFCRPPSAYFGAVACYDLNCSAESSLQRASLDYFRFVKSVNGTATTTGEQL